MINRVVMTCQEPLVRNQNFDEVALGYTYDEALVEASRCLNCKKPLCIEACPVNVDIPAFIQAIKKEDLDTAYKIIYKDNILPAICGRVCPQESQCEGSCVLGNKFTPVAIGALERFVGDYALHKPTSSLSVSEKKEKVAIVGSGPAGLACAGSMRSLGYQVDVYEALHEFGGVLKYGIPDFRLPKDIVCTECEKLTTLGVHFYKNVIIGKSITLEQLKNDYHYDAIFIASGAGLPSRLDLPNENMNGIYYANEFLTRVNLMKAGKIGYPTPIKLGENVAVIGGGNVAMDAARTAKRLGAKKVFILYRRDFCSLPARHEEIVHAQEEGIEFQLLKNPIEFIGENYELKKIKVEIIKLGEMDSSNRRKPVGTNTYELIDVDSCIISIGQSPNPIIKQSTPELATDHKGRIITNDYQTSIPGVFAGGDVVSGAATVILAMGAGKGAATHMDRYIQQK